MPAARRAQYFPNSASFRISLSPVRSETALRSRAFYFSSSFSRYTETAADLADRLTLAEPDLGFPEHANDLFGFVCFPAHSVLLQELELNRILTIGVDHFPGPRSVIKVFRIKLTLSSLP